jgi:hypothetical protein
MTAKKKVSGATPENRQITGKKAAPPVPAKPENIRADNPNTLQIKRMEGETDGWAHSRAMASPCVNAGMTMFRFHPLKDGANLSDLVDVVGKHATEIRGGLMDRPEAMLVAQAHTLDTIFNSLAQRAAQNMAAGYMQATETYLRLALKAQSQCRTTIEALGELKQPKSTNFIKQQNVAQQQQVNNGSEADSRSSTHAPARAHEKDITPRNELLTENRSATLDAAGQGAAIGADQGLEAMGAVHRPTH